MAAHNIKVGDIILQIQDKNVTTTSNKEVRKILLMPTYELNLIILQNKNPRVHQSPPVTIIKPVSNAVPNRQIKPDPVYNSIPIYKPLLPQAPQNNVYKPKMPMGYHRPSSPPKKVIQDFINNHKKLHNFSIRKESVVRTPTPPKKVVKDFVNSEPNNSVQKLYNYPKEVENKFGYNSILNKKKNFFEQINNENNRKAESVVGDRPRKKVHEKFLEGKREKKSPPGLPFEFTLPKDFYKSNHNHRPEPIENQWNRRQSLAIEPLENHWNQRKSVAPKENQWNQRKVVEPAENLNQRRQSVVIEPPENRWNRRQSIEIQSPEDRWNQRIEASESKNQWNQRIEVPKSENQWNQTRFSSKNIQENGKEIEKTVLTNETNKKKNNAPSEYQNVKVTQNFYNKNGNLNNFRQLGRCFSDLNLCSNSYKKPFMPSFLPKSIDNKKKVEDFIQNRCGENNNKNKSKCDLIMTEYISSEEETNSTTTEIYRNFSSEEVSMVAESTKDDDESLYMYEVLNEKTIDKNIEIYDNVYQPNPIVIKSETITSFPSSTKSTYSKINNLTLTPLNHTYTPKPIEKSATQILSPVKSSGKVHYQHPYGQSMKMKDHYFEKYLQDGLADNDEIISANLVSYSEIETKESLPNGKDKGRLFKNDICIEIQPSKFSFSDVSSAVEDSTYENQTDYCASESSYDHFGDYEDSIYG